MFLCNHKISLFVHLFPLIAVISFEKFIFCDEQSQWFELSKKDLSRNAAKLSDLRRQSKAKNVIMFIGDGMGLTTVTAARILKGQKQGFSGEEGHLSFETFENVALSKTFNIDSQVGDSGACATALFSGVKANYETIGLNEHGIYKNCESTFLSKIPSIIDWAQEEGKATGFVTTTRVTHATPAALYSHSASRYWESDKKLSEETDGICKDIARQLVEDDPGRNLNVILGGGRKHLMKNTEHDPQRPDLFGYRTDQRNLIEDWLLDKKSRDLTAKFVKNQKELEEVNSSKTDYLLGLFNYNHMEHEADREDSPEGEPSLSQMTQKAIEILEKNPHGYFLMVESGRIDHGHHQNNAYRALTDTLALNDAVTTALGMVNLNNTLLLVTSDHSHVFTFGGITKRGNDIFGVDNRLSDVDHLPYTTLLYANGPGYKKKRTLDGVDTRDKNYIQLSAVPRKWDSHGGEDVPIYATGAMSHLIAGVVDQTYIPHALSYASCMGPFKSMCSNRQLPVECVDSNVKAIPSKVSFKTPQNNSRRLIKPSVWLSLIFILLIHKV